LLIGIESSQFRVASEAMNKGKPIIGITMGDPAGIGPEITARTLAVGRMYDICRPIVVGDAAVLTKAVDLTGVGVLTRTVSDISRAQFEPGTADVLHTSRSDLTALSYGEVNAAAGDASFTAVKRVIELALAGAVDATVTGPINKASLNLAGHAYAGHTEIYAQMTGSGDAVMLLVHGDLRVAHVTTHVSLRKACSLVKKDRIVRVIELLADACRRFGAEEPVIGVAALNPHAGDGGLFGSEEAEEIAPAVEQAVELGIRAEGPIPADTLFPKAVGGVYHGCVAMYHDQGHIPFKLRGFSWDSREKRMARVSGVNITLGIPIIRTSVDHGTAFEIAGKGIASPDAMINAVEYAVNMATGAQRPDDG
jgi:4-hydroxythreonine-4-phosphate dehydrogenase